MIKIGIDVGGTFTDLVAVDAAGKSTLAKVASTPRDPSEGVLEGLGRLAELLGTSRAELLARTQRIVHGTTVATNALLELKGSRVGLLTTAGHRDVLEMREGLKSDRYNLRQAAPVPLVPRSRRLGVIERIRADGRIETPLSRDSLVEAIEELREQQVEAIAVCYLHAWRDDRHERETARELAQAMPGVYVSVSADVLPQIKEFQRVSTTVVNAYVGPTLARYLEKLERRLEQEGYRGPTLIMQSHGGVVPLAEAARIAAGAVLSGPAGGVAGSAYASKLLNNGNLIPFDIGGTSTDICLIVDGSPSLVGARGVGAHQVALNSLDIVSLGAGGGSIGWVDRGGLLHVGPQSAGADPGPACYGRGGLETTVTDANLVLGYLDADRFLGGKRKLDNMAACAALDRLADKLGVDRIAAAHGVHRVVNTAMAEGVRLVSVRRGVDPRSFALLSFGGAAGLHATDVARQLEIRNVIVPRVASVLSAWGMLATELRCEVSRTHIGDISTMDGNDIRRLFAELEQAARQRIQGWFDGVMEFRRSADMRYGEQTFEITVPLDQVDWSSPDPLPLIAEQFHRRHEALYTYSLREQPPVLINARVVAAGLLPDLPQEPTLPAAPDAKPLSRRSIWLRQWHEVPVYGFDTLAPGQKVRGPAIVESDMTTVLLGHQDIATTTQHGWLDIELLDIDSSTKMV